MQHKIFLILVCLLIFLHSCTSQSNKFVNHEKWMLESNLSRSKVKSNPVSVIESQYSNLNDTIFSDTLKGKMGGVWDYEFDKKGNIVSINFLMDSNLSSDIFYKIDQDGQHYEYFGYLKSDTTRSYVRSKKIAANKYKRETYRSGKKRYSEIWTFENDGQIVTKERYFSDTIGFVVKEIYEDGLLKKSEKSEKFLSSESIYYYSKGDYLDSLVVMMRNVPVMKFVYLNNNNGDPIYYEESVSGEVKERRWMKYIYDEKENWIKMIERNESGSDFNGFAENRKNPSFRLVERQIKY